MRYSGSLLQEARRAERGLAKDGAQMESVLRPFNYIATEYVGWRIRVVDFFFECMDDRKGEACL